MTRLEDLEQQMKSNIDTVLGTGDSDIRVPKEKIISDQILDTLLNTKLDESALKFKCFVSVFTINTNELPLYDIKMLQTICLKEGYSVSIE